MNIPNNLKQVFFEDLDEIESNRNNCILTLEEWGKKSSKFVGHMQFSWRVHFHGKSVELRAGMKSEDANNMINNMIETEIRSFKLSRV
jgi:hypothetical protein